MASATSSIMIKIVSASDTIALIVYPYTKVTELIELATRELRKLSDIYLIALTYKGNLITDGTISDLDVKYGDNFYAHDIECFITITRS